MKIKKYLFSFSALILALVVVFTITYDNKKEQKYTPGTYDMQKSSQGIKGAMKWMAKIKNDPLTGEFNAVAYLKARKQAELISNTQGKALGLTWLEMGPDNVGGRTRALLVDQNTPSTVYAGGVGGGLWYTTTGGTSWLRVSSITENLSICCIAQAADGDIYVGTGEGFTSMGGQHFYTPGILGTGIYKSEDGVTFTLLNSTIPTAPNNTTIEWAAVNRIACDPNNEGRVYAATNKGFKISDDGGTTWKTASYKNGNIYVKLMGNCDDVKVGSDGSVILACANKGYTSDNGNDSTFTVRSSNASTTLPQLGVNRLEFGIAPSDPNIVYCVVSEGAGALEGIYRSNDKGVSWYLIAPGGSANFNVFGDNNQGDYDNVIAVFPNNPDRILVGGINMWEGVKATPTGYFQWVQKTFGLFVHVDHHTYVFHPTNPNVYYMGTDGGIARTLDGGLSYQEINKNYNVTQFFAVACSGQGEVMGGTQDNRTPYIDLQGNTPMNAEVIFSGDGGWSAFSMINQDAIFATSYNAIMGRSPDKGGPDNWQFHDEFFSDRMLDNNTPQSPNIGASFVTPILLWESFGDLNSFDSIDFIADTNYPAGTTLQMRSDNAKYPFNYTTTAPITMGDTIKVQDIIQSKFFIGGNGNIWMTKQSLDFSITPEWFKIANFSGTVQAMAYSTDCDHLFVGTQDGKLYRISNILAAYDSTTADVTSANCIIETTQIKTWGRAVTSVAVDPNDPNRVVATLGSYGTYPAWIYMSTDALATTPTFNAKQGNLDDMPVYSALIEMNNPNSVIIGTEFGMFATDDITGFSPTWTQENTGMDNVPVFMIRQQTCNNPGATAMVFVEGDTLYEYYNGVTNYGVIYIGTHGRGIFQSQDYVGIPEINDRDITFSPELNVYPNPATVNTTISFKLQKRSSVNINVYDLSGKVVKTINLNQQSAGSHKQVIDCSGLPKGTYIINLLAGKNSATSKFIVL